MNYLLAKLLLVFVVYTMYIIYDIESNFIIYSVVYYVFC